MLLSISLLYSLRDNQIGADGARDLATMLEKNTTIHTLDLHANDIGAGVKDLATMLETNTTIHTLGHGCYNNKFSHSIATALNRNMALFTKTDRRPALQHAVSTKNISAIESLLERHHGHLEIEKALVVSLWNIVTQNNPKQATLKILVDLAIQSHASKLFPKVSHLDGVVLARLISNLDKVAFAHLLPHLDEAALARSLPHLDKAVLAQLFSHLDEVASFHVLSIIDEAVLAQVLSRLDGAALAQLLPHLDEAAFAHLLPHLRYAALARLLPHLDKAALAQSLPHLDKGALARLLSHLDEATLAQLLSNLDGAALAQLFSRLDEAPSAHLVPHLDEAALAQLVPHLDEAALAQLVPHLDEAALAQLVPHLDEAALAQLVPHLDEAALAQLLPHLDEAALAQLLPHLDEAALAQSLSHLDKGALAQLLSRLDKAALAQLLPHLDEAALAHLLPHCDEAALAHLVPLLDEAALAHLRLDPRPEIKSMAEIALMPVNSSFDPSHLAQQLTSLLGLPTDVFAEDGTPLPSIFLERASANISTRLINLAAAAVRYMLERQHKREIQTWVDAHPDANTLMTGLDVTKSAEKHLERYADTPLDLQQNNQSLERMVVPKWYDQVLVQPAVEAVRNQLEQRRVAALANTKQTDTCQKLAKDSLEADRLLYGGALSKAQQQNRAGTRKMELLAEQKQAQTQGKWATDIHTGKPQRPTHPNMSASATVAQVKLQAVQQGGAFRTVVESMHVATGLTVSMVKGSVDHASGLLRKHKGGIANQDSSFYMSKGGYRIAQKLWVRGNVQSICDINRALFVADTFEDLFKIAEHIFSRSDIRIVDIKDRVNNPTYGGWSDLVLLFSIEGTSGHIHELQLALTPMMVARGAMAAHDAYAIARYFVEMLQKCDLEYDSESLESKLHKTNEKLKNVIEDQKLPGRALCGWLQQAEGEKKKWKRRWLVLSDGLLTYHNSKVKSSLTTWERLKVAKGATPMVTCSIFLDKDPHEEHKFEIVNKTEGIHLHLDKSSKQEPTGETHTRTEWVDAMTSHTGCKMYTRTDWADTMLMP